MNLKFYTMNISNDFIAIFAIFGAVILPVGLGIYLALQKMKQQHKERMAMIEKGLMPEIPEKENEKGKKLKSGFTLVGIGAGLIVGLLVGRTLGLNESDMFWAVAPSILLFLGIAYLAYYFVNKNKDAANEER